MTTDKVNERYSKFLDDAVDLPENELERLRKFYAREGISVGTISIDSEGFRSFAVSKTHGIVYSSTENFPTTNDALTDAVEKANEYYNTRLNHPDNFELEKIIKDVFEKGNKGG